MKKIFGKYFIQIFFSGVIIISHIFNYSLGIKIGNQFFSFFINMITFLPMMFILVGLVDVWFPKEVVEQNIGKDSGIKGIFWIVLLSMLQAGPLYGAFPVAHLLWKKGASIRNIFIYLGAFATIKIPILTFEIGFMGIKFSFLRTVLSLFFFIIIAMIMEKYLKNKNFEIKLP
ncbi:MAG: permease [Endomicrobiia bacterium]